MRPLFLAKNGAKKMHSFFLQYSLDYLCWMNSTILITGATSGFGKATAEKFAANGWRLILTGRRLDRLNDMATAFAAQGNQCITLCFDVQNRQETETALQSLPQEWKSPDILVNNAGLALGRSSVQEGDPADWDTMIDTNIKGLLYVSRIVLPWMIAAGKGHVINIGSVAGKETYPDGNVYCATKFAVDALSRSMRTDLLPHGIRVTQISPGMAETEFSKVRFKGDESKANAVYKGIQPLTGADIADIIYFAATVPSHVCLNDIVVTCTAQANATTFKRN
jgi:3-hydroxy acid dehydrogenase / malonic semialdehyde reductase